ncbi:MAG TPA: hypothetical protein VFR68_03390 [Candidatus Dormibacteraeota bacterium]|nr:hypothetical protein [Candidatus Dormibacteraeota bacterium]
MVTRSDDSESQGSLRRAIEQTDRSPGNYVIRFSSSLAGSVLHLRDPLPALTVGSVYIEGDDVGDGRPHITLEGPAGGPAAIRIASGGNTIHALAIRGFSTGIVVDSTSHGSTFAANTIAAVDIQADQQAVDFSPFLRSTPRVDGMTWNGLQIIQSSLEAKWVVIHVAVVTADSLKNVTVRDNKITADGPGNTGGGIGISAGQFIGADGNQISNVLIAANRITSNGTNAIALAAGQGGAGRNTISQVQIIDNQLEIAPGGYGQGQARDGINIVTGDSGTDDLNPGYRPIIWPEGNLVQNVLVAGNVIDGQGGSGLSVQGGINGAKNNHINHLVIEGNQIHGSAPTEGGRGDGIFIEGAETGPQASRPSSANEISDVEIRANDITEDVPAPLGWLAPVGGIVLVGGSRAQGNQLGQILVDANTISTTELAISVIGGWAPSGPLHATGNSISGVNIECTSAARSLPLVLRPEVIGISVVGGYGNAQNNTVKARALNNLIGDKLNVISQAPDESGMNRDATGADAIASANSVDVTTG